MVPRLLEKYNQTIVSSLTEKLKKTNVHTVPKLEKIVVNMGVGSAIQDKKYLEEAVDVLTQIYEHVFNIELREDKGIILHLLKTTLSRIEPGNDLIVHISSDDYDDIMEQKEELDACITSPNTSMEIIEDPLLKENECMIESDSGVFDCSLGVELSEITRKLKLLSFDRKRR